MSADQLKMLDHLAKLINGIIGSGHTQLPKIATKEPRADNTESKIATLKCLVDHDKFSQELFWLPFPFVRVFLVSLVKSRSDGQITLVMDGSVVGRGCMAFLMSVVYVGRALPIAWLVVNGKKDHLGQKTYICNSLKRFKHSYHLRLKLLF